MRLDRLRQLTRQELLWRASTLARSHALRLAAAARPPRWERSRLARVLAPGALEGDGLAALAAGDWNAVHRALAARITGRPARFVLDPASASAMRDVVLFLWPGAADDARERAARIERGEYDLLGYRGLHYANDNRRVDWHFDPVHRRRAPLAFYTQVPYLDPAVGDHKVIWEINRHQHWLRLGRAAWLTGDARYADTILDDLYGWLDANPPLVGINWASMLEVGFRAISWTWCLHSLLAFPAAAEPVRPWLVDMLIGLDRQLTHVEHNLSYYFSPNTHLTGEALALYVAGTALPELAAAPRWAATGRNVLLDEIDRQVLADGGHAERSTHYQRYTLDFYVLALLTARLAQDAGAEARFADAALRLATFTRAIADDNGRLPLIGDDDGGMLWPLTGRDCNDVRDSLSTAAAVLGRPELSPWDAAEETAWVAGPGTFMASVAAASDSVAVRATSVTLRATGYVVMRDGCGGHAVFDAGSHGYMNGGHAHADALSVTLALAGRPLLVDPGTSTYIVDAALRDRMRSSLNHNTVSIDGRSQSSPSGPFHWHARTDGRLVLWRHNDGFDWAEGAHDGYDGLRHHRAILRTARGGWFIADQIHGRGRHCAAAHWHFDPAWTLDAEAGRVRATLPNGDVAWLLHEGEPAHVFRGDNVTGLGWHAPVYGTLLPSPTARVTVDGDAPLGFVTWIGDGREWRSPVLRRLPVECDAGSPALSAQIADDDHTAVFMLRATAEAPYAARACRVLDYETDARLLHYTTDGDRLAAVSAVDVSHLVTSRRGWLALEAEAPLPDVHLAIDGLMVDIRATTPAATLRVRGITNAHRVRLNGHPFTRPGARRVDSLVVRPDDWPAASATPLPARPWPGAAFAQH